MSRMVLVVAVFFVGWLGALAQAQRTPSEGVYTAEQATAGQALYRAQCTGCHGPTLGGMAGPALRGDTFLKNWSGRTLEELVDKIQKTMPANDPGKLTRTAGDHLVAYMLQAGKFPAGNDALWTTRR